MASTYLSKTFSSGTTKKWTFSCWIKRSNISSAQTLFYASPSANSNFESIGFTTSGDFDWEHYEYTSSSYKGRLKTNRLFRDISAWYHIVCVFDSANATAGNRMRLYVNGTEETSFATDTNPTQNQDAIINGANPHTVGSFGTGQYFDGLITHVHFTDGYAYAASDFGETDSTSGIWKPKTAPSVTYGTNGFFLKFENSGAMGTDSSGNSNTFTVSGTLTQNVDTPSNNFAALNPLDVSRLANTGNTFSNGNLTVTDGASSYLVAQSTLATTTGKFYWEVKINATASDTASGVGIVDLDNFSRADGAGNTAYGWIYAPDGDKRNSGTSTAYGNTYTANDIIGIALDLDNGFLYFSKNGTWQNSGNPESGASGTGSAYGSVSGTIGAHAYDGSGSIAHEYSFNFGQGYFGTTAVASAGTSPSEGGIFEYDCPNGYQSLSTKGINSF